MGTWVDLDGTDGGRGWIAKPESGDGPGVLVLHPWWGLNETVRRYTDGLAGDGFVALAPDLYRGRVVDTIEAAEAAANDLSADDAKRLVRAAADRLRDDEGELGRAIGVVGFSLGCAFALALASGDRGVDAVVLYYGTGGEFDWSGSRAAFLGHFAENDPYEEPEYVDALRRSLEEAGRAVTFHVYPATSHWFAEPDRPEYAPEAASLARERTVAFLRENLGPLGA